MRQSMRLEPIQPSLSILESLDREIADIEASLWQLGPGGGPQGGVGPGPGRSLS